MMMYRFNWRYSSSLGAGDKGDEIDLTAEEADLYNRDSPGVLSPVDEDEDDELNLAKMKRDELNLYAIDAGIEDPESYPNKDALIEAIAALATRSLDAPQSDRMIHSASNRGIADDPITKETFKAVKNP